MTGCLKWVIFLALLPAALWALFWIFAIGLALIGSIFR